MKLFLQLKHWQLFLIWFLAEIIFFATQKTAIWILTFLLFEFTIIGWIYAIGKVVNNLNETNKVENYREDWWFVIYIITIMPFGYYTRSFDSGPELSAFWIFVPGLVGFVSGIKMINFSAKALAQYEEKKDLKFSEYTNEFLLILFVIIGIWILQPKLNKMFGNK
jgi:hypothetical protein